MMTITLGDEVEDIVTGFSGTATGRHTFLYGMPTITVQPLLVDYGHLLEAENFYESQLKIISHKKKKVISIK